MSLHNPGWERAEFHEARARNYRRQAELLRERDGDNDSAGILLYESAKQCINALANQWGSNPTSTGAKVRFLRNVAEREPPSLNLTGNWRAANRLHVHADRGHLSESDFDRDWESAQTFIEQMLLIYAGDEWSSQSERIR